MMTPKTRPFVLWAGAAAACAAAAAPVPYLDPAQPVEARVQDLLGRMTLDEKVAQLQGVETKNPHGFETEDQPVDAADAALLANGAGTVWVGPFDAAAEVDMFALDPAKQIHRANAVQRYMLHHTRLGIPVLTLAESLHGYMMGGATSFPVPVALGSTWDPALVERVFTAAAQEASARGDRQVLAPVLDLGRDPRWGRFEECYGEDPYLVAQMGLAAVWGLQGRGPQIDTEHVAATLKHFAGHGQAQGGRNIAPLSFGEREFRAAHLYPFEQAIRVAHAQSVMASYNSWDGVPNHVSHRLLTEILRGEWGFDGYVMSDGGGIDVVYQDHQAAAGPVEAGDLSLLAGVDYDLGSEGHCFATLPAELKAGRVSLDAINRAAAAVLRVKLRLGLFEHPYADPARCAAVTNSAAHRALARQAAEEAMILLKNDGPVLPLDPAKVRTLAVIGPNAAEIHLGGYSAVPMRGTSVLDGLRAFLGATASVLYAEGCKLTVNHAAGWLANENPVLNDPADDSRLIDQAVAVAQHSDAVVLVLGESELLRREAWSAQHLGDRDTLDLVGRQHELATAILATGKPAVILLVNGGPLSIPGLAAKAPALMECWYLGEETGGAVAAVLFGQASPGGKLTVTLPRTVGQLPDYYDHEPSRMRDYVLADSTPLFPFGFGLSYTRFSYANLQVSPGRLPPGQAAAVAVDVTNTGPVAADEVVELYLHARVSLPVRPVLELKDFRRITLRPGERQTVRFTVGPEQLAAWDLAMRRRVTPGDFDVLVGRSSADLLKTQLTVE